MKTLTNSKTRILSILLAVLLVFQISIATVSAAPAEECDHEYTYDIQFDFYELNYTSKYACLSCYNVFDALALVRRLKHCNLNAIAQKGAQNQAP